MVRTIVKVLVADAILLAAEYFVLQDLGWRSDYAYSQGLSPTYSYSIFTQYFAMLGRGLALQGPPTLDWTQVLVVLLVMINAVYIYRALTGKRPTRQPS